MSLSPVPSLHVLILVSELISRTIFVGLLWQVSSVSTVKFDLVISRHQVSDLRRSVWFCASGFGWHPGTFHLVIRFVRNEHSISFCTCMRRICS